MGSKIEIFVLLAFEIEFKIKSYMMMAELAETSYYFFNM